jgi:steroid delta-isomerase
MPTEEVVRKTIAEYFAALRAMDAVAWAATFSSDAVSHDPVGAPPHRGPAAIQAFATGVFGLFEKVGLTEDQVYVCGNEAAVKWTGRGVGKNGKQVTFEGIDVLEVNDQGKIRGVRAYWNPGPTIAAVSG